MKTALICFAVIGLLGAGIFIHNKNIAARREAYGVLDQRKKAYGHLQTVETAVSNVADIARRAEPYLLTASNLVTDVLGAAAFPVRKSLVEAAVGPRGIGKPSATVENPGGLLTREQIEARRAMQSDAAGGAPARPPPPVRHAPPSPPPPSDEPRSRPTEDNPAGLMTREDIERRREGKTEPKREAAPSPARTPEAEKPAPPPPPPPPPQAVATPPADADRDVPIKVTYRRVESCLIRLRELDKNAFEVGAQARTIYEDILTSRALSNAIPRVEAIAPLAETATGMHKESLDLLQQTRNRLDDVRKEKARVEEERARAAEAERQRRAEEEHQALIAAEVKRAADMRPTQTPKVRKWEFAALLDEAKAAQEAMKTPEGKQAMEPLIERASRLVAFQQFLIGRLVKVPFRWGWGEGGASRDIVSADMSGVKYTGGSTAWADISVRQLVKILDHYLADERLGYKALGENYLAASLLLRDLDGGEPGEVYGRKAVQCSPSLEREVIRLK
jgi:hypothetical protein